MWRNGGSKKTGLVIIPELCGWPLHRVDVMRVFPSAPLWLGWTRTCQRHLSYRTHCHPLPVRNWPLSVDDVAAPPGDVPADAGDDYSFSCCCYCQGNLPCQKTCQQSFEVVPDLEDARNHLVNRADRNLGDWPGTINFVSYVQLWKGLGASIQNNSGFGGFIYLAESGRKLGNVSLMQ